MWKYIVTRLVGPTENKKQEKFLVAHEFGVICETKLS